MIDLKSLANAQLTAAIAMLQTEPMGYSKQDLVKTLEEYPDKRKLMMVIEVLCNGIDYVVKSQKPEQAALPAPAAVPQPASGGGSLDGIVSAMVHAEVERIKADGAFTSKTIVLQGSEKRELENEVLPEEFEQIMHLVSLRKNIMLVGPTGCGKTHVASSVARARTDNNNFGSISVTYGMSKSDLLGLYVPMGESGQFVYVPSTFVHLYENGGTFLIDEMDNGDPNTFGIINQASSNNEFWLPIRPERPHVKRHPDFVLIAAANTYGTGADMQYVGRAQLDRATLDRFKSGVVEMDYSPTVEKALIDPEVLRWGLRIRNNIKKYNLHEVMSTRFLIDMTDLKKAYDYTSKDWEDIFFQGVADEDRSRMTA